MNKDTLEKLFKIQSEVSELIKTKQAKGDYLYEDLDSVMKLLRPHLTEHRLVLMHNIQEISGSMYGVTTVHDVDAGDHFCVTCPVAYSSSHKMSEMQSIGSCNTYSFRYNLKNIFALVSKDDDSEKGDDSVISPNSLKELKALFVAAQKNKEFNAEEFYLFVEGSDFEKFSESQAKLAITALKENIS